jgi:hypothetical protein
MLKMFSCCSLKSGSLATTTQPKVSFHISYSSNYSVDIKKVSSAIRNKILVAKMESKMTLSFCDN